MKPGEGQFYMVYVMKIVFHNSGDPRSGAVLI